MKRFFTFLFAVSLLSITTWAADTSVTEKFTRVTQTGSSGAGGSSWTGDVCGWETKFARRGTSDKLNGNQCTWITLNGSDVRGYIKTTNLEGGIKTVSFYYGQFGAESNTVLKWHVSALGTTTISDIIERDGDLGGNTSTDGDSYSHTFSCKENAQLRILNMSETDDGYMPANGKARLLVNNITITPYLLYRNKDVTVGLKQHGYANNGSVDFINNTGSEGTITFSSSDESVAKVDPETGVVTPVSAGNAVITATWSEGASTTYTLHVVDGIVAENFSKVKQTGQTSGATWHGDLFDWNVANVRRGVDDTLGLSPRIQATAMRSNTGSTIISANTIEGGVKRLAFDWRQWASATSPLTFNAYYSADIENWGDAVATQAEDAVKASEPHAFDADIDNGAKGNAYLKLEYTSGGGVAVIGALKITPYLLYTNKAATLDTRNALNYKNNDLINNTTGEAVVYSIAPIAPTTEGATINAGTGEVTAANDETEGNFMVTATWGAVTTTYILAIVSRTATTASYENAKVALNLGADVPANILTKTAGYDGTISYESSNTAVATVTNDGIVSLTGGVGQATITATLPQTENYKATEAKYNIFVEDPSALVETFSAVPKKNAAGHHNTVWDGDLFDWRVLNAVRKNGDVFPSNEERTGIWIAIPNPDESLYGIIQSENAVEGGIKHLSFYWEQWGSESNHILKPVVYSKSGEASEEMKGSMEYMPSGSPVAANRMLFGANDVMRTNSQLIIKNESHKSDNSRVAGKGRFILDEIHITPYLLYTDKTKRSMHIGATDKNESLVNNTGGDASYESSNTAVATVATDGTVTAIGRGTATITASYQWSENEIVTTWYEVEVYPVNCETFDGIEQTSNYGNTTPREGDKATWSTSLGGFNAGDLAALTTNLVRFRAPYQESSDEAYIQSTAIEGGIASMTFDWNLAGAETATNWDIRVIINGREVKKLTNTDITATNAMDHFEQIAINDINEPGNFTIRFENHSTISDTYTSGNKARFLIDNIIWTNYAGTKTLSENADNSDWIRNNAGETRNVIISRSDLVANVWNTLCLPFAISRTTDLNGAAVQQLNDASLDGNSLTITFSTLVGDELTAGTPYLVMPDVSNINISGTYENKSIAIVASQVEGPVTMQGIYSPTLLKKDDYSTLFVGTPDGEGRNLYYPSADGNLKGFRAYFKISDPSVANAPIRYARFVVNQQEVATEIDENGNPKPSLRKEIENGTLVIIRDGIRYDVFGRKQ